MDTKQDSPEVSEASQTPEETLAQKNNRSLVKLVGLIIFSFILAWGSIPLYRLVCKVVDPGGSSWQNGETDSYENVEVDESRTVRVRFTSEVNSQLPWTFGPTERSVVVHPGEKRLTKFIAENLENYDITGQGVYDINPPQAGQYFKKIECFCFTEQTLSGGEKADMPLYFWFDPELPENIKEITLAYTFFNADSSRTRSKQRGSTAQK